MTSMFARAVTVGLLIAGTAILAAPDQTARPGQMTDARVWIQNRGRSEAVPIDLRDVNLEAPLRVQVMNAEAPISNSNAVQVREVRRQWDYETMPIAADAIGTLPALLNARGANGWETTGIAFSTAAGTTLLLKRPR
jgi:hypothetical protein